MGCRWIENEVSPAIFETKQAISGVVYPNPIVHTNRYFVASELNDPI